MKNKIRNVIGIMLMTATIAIVFSVIQLNTPIVRANPVCPSSPFPPCDCRLVSSVQEPSGKVTCWYVCECGGPGRGGGEPFEIERMVEVD